MFVNPDMVKNIVQLLYTRNAGFTRKEIVEKLEITDGGRVSCNLNALLSSELKQIGEEIGVVIQAQNERIFDIMHRI